MMQSAAQGLCIDSELGIPGVAACMKDDATRISDKHRWTPAACRSHQCTLGSYHEPIQPKTADVSSVVGKLLTPYLRCLRLNACLNALQILFRKICTYETTRISPCSTKHAVRYVMYVTYVS